MVWGLPQGLIFLGVILAIGSFAAWGYLYFVAMPRPNSFTVSKEALEKITPAIAWEYWVSIRQGMPTQPSPDIANFVYRTQVTRKRIKFALVGGVAGLGLVVGGMCMPRTKAIT